MHTKRDAVVGYFMGHHQTPEDMPHADSGVACHHKHDVFALEDFFAQPPILVAVDFDTAVVEEVRRDLDTASGDGAVARLLSR